MKDKICLICKQVFTPTSSAQKICIADHFTKCPICGKDMIWNSTSQVEPCSKECRKELTKQKNIAKYGVPHPMMSKEVQANHKKAMLEKYGVESPLQSAELKQKARDSIREKFGTDWALSNKEVKQKAMDTMEARYGSRTTLQSDVLRKKVDTTVMKKYGVTNVMKATVVSDKVKQTNLSRYGVANVMQNTDIASRSAASRIAKNGAHWTEYMSENAKETWWKPLRVDNPAEINRAFSQKLNYVNIKNDVGFTIGAESYDIRVVNSNTLIEIDSTYDHNILSKHWNKKELPTEYHLNKTKIANDAGYHCIHMFDWDDVDKIIDLVSPKKTLYARNMEIYKLNLDVTEEFLRKYHIQNSCQGQLLCLGLVANGELYQVMTFGRPRYDKKHDVELLRLCTKAGYVVIGGASRLFKFATEQYGLNNIISYCDLAKFNGEVYEKLGMTLIRKTEPQEIWSRGSDKITANLLRSRGYDQLFRTNYGKGSSNGELMITHGWLPVYDCGQAVYEYYV